MSKKASTVPPSDRQAVFIAYWNLSETEVEYLKRYWREEFHLSNDARQWVSKMKAPNKPTDPSEGGID